MLQHLEDRAVFLNFGIGNGKSLLCSTLAIILKKIQNKNVIILNKSDYLTYRDYQKFKNCIDSCDLRCSRNSIEKNSIAYLDEKHFKLLCNGKLKGGSVEDSILILDEYDHFLFE